MQESIIEGLPGFLNELNELTFWGLLGLIVIYLIIREVLRARYHKRARSMVEKAINGGGHDGDGDALSSRPIGNPHTSHDPAVLFAWLIEEVRLHRVESDRRFSRLEGKLGELRGELNAMKGGGS